MKQHVVNVLCGAVLVWGTWVTTHATLAYNKAARVDEHQQRHHQRLNELTDITRTVSINQARLTGMMEITNK